MQKRKTQGDRPGAQYSVATRGASDAAQSVPSSRSHQTVTISQLTLLDQTELYILARATEGLINMEGSLGHRSNSSLQTSVT
jgi:hypothetical protein